MSVVLNGRACRGRWLAGALCACLWINGAAGAELTLQTERSSPYDLEISGGLEGQSEGTVSYVRWDDLAALPTTVLEVEGEFVLDAGGDELRLRILQHQPDGTGEPMDRFIQRVLTGNLQLAEEPASVELRHNAREGQAQGGLAGTGWAQQPDDFTPIDRE